MARDVVFRGLYEIDNGQAVELLYDNDTNASEGQSMFVNGSLSAGTYYVRVIDENINSRSQEYYNLCLQCAIVSNTHSVNTISASVYPNPVSNQLFIRTEENDLNYQLSHLNGQIARAGTLQQQFIDVRGLVAGIYLLELTNQNQYFVTRIVVE